MLGQFGPEAPAMRLPRYRLRTLLIGLAVAAVNLAPAALLLRWHLDALRGGMPLGVAGDSSASSWGPPSSAWGCSTGSPWPLGGRSPRDRPGLASAARTASTVSSWWTTTRNVSTMN